MKSDAIPLFLLDDLLNISHFLICRFYNDSVNAGAEEYIPKKLFVVGGDESGETTTCHGDSGSPVVRRVASSRIGTRLVIIVRFSLSLDMKKLNPNSHQMRNINF